MVLEQCIPVLVAEDSEDNRFLLQAYCRGTAFDLTFAEDGAKAVSAYQAGSFEMVVMDIQMPVMDGLVAARLIRDLESVRGRRRTPILALTANVMPNDVVQALEAGCDLHLPKPISKKGFLTALEQWKPIPMETGLSTKIEIPEGLEQLAASYLTARRQEIPLLGDLCTLRAFDKIAWLAHDLKGTGSSLGLAEISRVGGAIEQAALSEDEKAIREQISALSAYLDKVNVQMRKMS